jgi:hypothetical protein
VARGPYEIKTDIRKCFGQKSDLFDIFGSKSDFGGGLSPFCDKSGHLGVHYELMYRSIVVGSPSLWIN